MGQLLSSKISIVEEEPRVRGIPSLPTAVVGAIGISERGPINKPVLVNSFEEYQGTFGGFTRDSDLALAAAGFFANGGNQLWVSRVVHYDDVADAVSGTALRGSAYVISPGAPTPAAIHGALAETFALDDGAVIVLSVDGGADQSTTFVGTPAQVVAADLPSYLLADGQTLTLRIDGGPEQTITFFAADFVDIGAAAPDEVAAVINEGIVGGKALLNENNVLTIASDRRGTSSTVHVTGGTADVALAFPGAVATGAGNVGNLDVVTFDEVRFVVEAAIGGVVVAVDPGGVLALRTVSTGSAATLQSSAMTHSSFGFDSDLHTGSDAGDANVLRVEGVDPGGYSNRIRVQILAATSGDSAEFDFAVIDDGAHRERFPNLSMDPTSGRYVELVLNDPRSGSSYVRVTDQLVEGTPMPSQQTVALTGGDDGLTDLSDADFVGSPASKTGLYALDKVQDLSLLIVPGRATPAVHNAMIGYCETTRSGSVFAILDPPERMSAAEIVTYVQSTAAILQLSEFAGIYWPRVKVLNPSKSIFGRDAQIVVPPSGTIAGVYARTDGARPGGVYDPPAGIDKGRMFGVLGFETDEVLEEAKRDLVYPKRINPLTTGPGLPRFIDGSKTLKGSGSFPYIAERRGVIFIEQSIKTGLQFARHKNNTEGLRGQVRRTITAFLLTQMNNNAFRSKDPTKAFFVDTSERVNTPSVIFAGKLIAQFGVATNKPAEFIILRVSQDTRALEAELANAAA